MKRFWAPTAIVALSFVFLPFLGHASEAAHFNSADETTSSAPQDQSPLNPQTPQPGQPDSPFQLQHFWNRTGLELSGGYVSVMKKGAGYFNKGFNVTGGVVDHLSPNWDVLAEAHFFGLQGVHSNTDFGLSAGISYAILPRPATNPYVIGGVGYYYLGTITAANLSPQQCINAFDCPFNFANSANAIGYNGGIGIRHRLFIDRAMSFFAEARYHYIASKTSQFGDLSMLPVSAGLRW